MLVTLALAAFHLGIAQVPARDSRALFARALGKVGSDWSMDQVKGLLGPPDETYLGGDFVEWEYGTRGSHTMPTLGAVVFARNRIFEMAGSGEPPVAAVIGEQELIDSLRRIYDWQDAHPNMEGVTKGACDSLRLLRAANVLIGKGQTKAMAILSEYSRLSPARASIWLHWLVRSAFTSDLPGGVFPYPGAGLMSPQPPKDHRTWPTYPVMIIDNWPVNFFDGIHFDSGIGGWVPVPMYGEHCTIRSRPLIPPADPFLSYQAIDASSWRHPKPDSSMDRFVLPGRHWNKQRALRGILTLVSTVYRPAGVDPEDVDPANYEKYHREFLALHSHWDAKLQCYVR